MHERHARALAIGIGAATVAAAVAFAWFGTVAPAPRASAPPSAPATTAATTTAPTSAAPTTAAPASADAARGAALFVELGCARCHAFRGVGDPSGALDDAASRADPAELARWITADPAVADQLPRKARAAKARYRDLPPEDLAALVAWLRAPPP